MVNFSVFNELSLPLLDEYTAKEKFGEFFKLLKELSDKGVNQIRMSDDFKQYPILKNVTFGKFLGKQERKDPEFKTRLKGFITSNIVTIDTPIIQESEPSEIAKQQTNEYFYNDEPTNGGLACCDIWNTIAVSFDSDKQWENDNISITKERLDEKANINPISVEIKHASKINHLTSHQAFFDALKEEVKLEITQKSFWIKRDTTFPNIIIFCPEIEDQIKKLDKKVFKSAISILRDVEKGEKGIKDYNCSPESATVRQNTNLKKERMFTVDGQKTFFENHIKSLPKGYRIYFLAKDNKIYIGYIGKHLPLK